MDNVYQINNVSITEIEGTSTFLNSVLLASSISVFIIILIMIISLIKLFKNCGEKGYKAIIPIYNMVTLLKIVEMPAWYVLLFFIPLVNLFVLASVNVKLSNKFNKSALFAVGLLFLPFIFYPILAVVSTSKENKEKSKKVKEIKDKKNIEKTKDENGIICPVCGTALAPDSVTCFICNTNLTDNIETITPEENTLNENEVTDNNSVNNINNTPVDFMIDLDENSEKSIDNSVDSNINIHDILEDNNQNITNEVVNTPVYNINSEDDQEEKIDSIFDEETEEFESVEEYELDHPSITNQVETQIENKIDNKEINLSVSNNFEVLPESKPKYVSSTKTLDEILKINSKIYEEQRKNQELKNEQNKLLEEEELMKKVAVALSNFHAVTPEEMEENNVILEENNETINPVGTISTEKKEERICKTCGSVVPEFTDICLLCETPYTK